MSSIICSSTIYLQPSTGPNVPAQPPYFLQVYSTVVNRESINKSIPLVKVNAVSFNSNNLIPLSYSIVSDGISETLFYIDQSQGFIYPRNDLSLRVQTYFMQVN